MDWQLLKRHIFLILSFIFLSIAGLNFLIFEKDAPGASQYYYASYIQNHIKKEIETSKGELNLVGTKYQKATDLAFANFEVKTGFPYYIYRDGQLIYWSDHRYVPDYQAIQSNRETRLLSTENGKYIANRLIFGNRGHRIEIYSLINLYRAYSYENEYLQTGFNTAIFPTDPKDLIAQPQKNQHLNILDEKGSFLFSILPPQIEKLGSGGIPTNTLILIGISLFFLGIYVIVRIIYLEKKHQFGRAFLLMFGYLMFIRIVMLLNNVPFIFYESDLFNPKFFSTNFLAPSLGDALLNSLVALHLIGFVVLFYYRSNLYYRIYKASKSIHNYVAIICVIGVFGITYISYRNLSNIYEKSKYYLDLSLSISFDSLKTATIAFYIFLSVIFFLGVHLLSSVFMRLNKNRKQTITNFIIGFIIGFIFIFIIDSFRWIYIATSLYFLMITLAKLPGFFYSFRYQTSIYFFTGAFIFALISLHVIYYQELRKDLYDKQRFGLRYLTENDLLGEGLLVKSAKTISEDSDIKAAIMSTTLVREKIQQLVKNNHLDLYFDKYDTEVLAFDAQGTSLDISEGVQNLLFYERAYRQDKYKTSNPNVFFVNDVGNNFIKQYITFVPISENNQPLGTVILDLKLRDEYTESVYPGLLMDKKFVQNPESKNYSYAIFDKNNRLIYNTGSYNYELKLPYELLHDSTLYERGIQLNDYYHVGVKGDNSRKIVISTKHNPLGSIFSNFSFLFLISVLCIILVILFYLIRYGFKNMNINFATKIQLYLNAAFLLPLILVIILTLSVIKSTFTSNQEKAYLDNTKNIISTLQLQLESFLSKRMSRAFLEQEINDLAHDTKVDINLYDLNGKLYLTTRKLVYQNSLLSQFINPVAYRRIIEEKENESLLDESLGSLNYKSVYMNIKGQNGKPIGVVGIPFFDAKPVLNRQLTDVVASIMSIFAWLFLILLVISYFVSNILTNPLQLVAQKLKKTNLDKLNNPLEWNSDDEIGLLMREYNKMLRKLEDSKVALSMSEKQTAWREMAKQVAHEIKNPLTPMKLSIQQLQRTITIDNPKAKERIERALNSLTEQIDNISDIATSFSEFAKMPVPRNEVFDLVSVVQKISDLYAEDDNISLNAYLKERVAYVLGDRQFMSRVITNLVINGIQSVPKDRKPIINLRLYRNDDDNVVIIEVQDNGNGIPENIRQRVFMPNFSTKIGGSGLGLAMAKRGVEHAGGNIWFETQDNRGTTFFIDLPLAKSGE